MADVFGDENDKHLRPVDKDNNPNLNQGQIDGVLGIVPVNPDSNLGSDPQAEADRLLAEARADVEKFGDAGTREPTDKDLSGGESIDISPLLEDNMGLDPETVADLNNYPDLVEVLDADGEAGPITASDLKGEPDPFIGPLPDLEGDEADSASGQTAIAEGYDKPMEEPVHDGVFEAPDNPADAIERAEVEAGIDEFNKLSGAQKSPKEEYTAADFRRNMESGTYSSRLLYVFDLLKEGEEEFKGWEDIQSLEAGDIVLYTDALSIISDASEFGEYKLLEDGRFSIHVVDYETENSPLRDIKFIRNSVRLLQRAFLTYHDLLDEEPNFQGDETRFLDGATCLAGDEPLEMAYSELSKLPKKKLPGHEIVTLGNEELTINVYNPGNMRPIFSADIYNNGQVVMNTSYGGLQPITFETIARGLDTLEKAYRAFIGLDISPKTE